jgi:hypothetical protein
VAQLSRDERPPKPGPRIEIVRLKANQSTDLVVYSEKVHGFWIHWCGERSGPCYDPRSECRSCCDGLPRRWKGYLYCWSTAQSDNVFFELTPLAVKSIYDVVGQGCILRGYRMNIQRGNGNKAWMKVTLKSRFQDVSDKVLPDDISPEKTLLQLWGVSDDKTIAG